MGLFHESLDNFDDLFSHQLQDVYDAELQLTDALPKMAEAAHSSDLKSAFSSHLQQTRVHVARLEQAFGYLGRDVERTTCPAMKGLIKEGHEAVSAKGDPRVKDAALIAAAQRVEHYEMAAYGTLRNLALTVGREDVATLFQQTLDEEGQADRNLTLLANQHINADAASSTAN
jgi:ferritin-like metal-binding protein YciE